METEQKLRSFTGIKRILVCSRDHDLIWEETVWSSIGPEMFCFHIIMVE